MRATSVLLWLSAVPCLLACGCAWPKPAVGPTATAAAERVTAIASAQGPAVRIEGAGGRTATIKIHSAAGELLTTRPQPIPPGHWYQFQPKLQPGTYTLAVEIGGALYGSCKLVISPHRPGGGRPADRPGR